jgi:ABC-2 type transport system permease protein
MNADFITVLWKEWKEIVLERGSVGGLVSWNSASGWGRPLILVAVVGILIPLRMPPEKFFVATQLLLPVFLSAFVITAVIADSFAGERERHTLETLLASRLSDRSILFGKIAASMAYGWLISVACIVTGIITVNVKNWQGQILIYHDAASWLIILLGPPLLGAAIATVGVLVSLHAATVRQAQQTLAVGLMILFFAIIFGSGSLPMEWKLWFAGIVVTWTQAGLVLGAAGVLLAIDLALLFASMARFQRSRLVLD